MSPWRAADAVLRVLTSQTWPAWSTIGVWPNLGSAALASTIGKSGRTRKPMITTKCVCAVILTETRGARHGAQIPETPGHWANQAPLTTVLTGDVWVWCNRTCIRYADV